MYKKVLLPVSGKKHGERAHQALKHALGLCSGEILEKDGVSFHTRVEEGTPAETIVRVADEENADLIVMFTDGRDGLGDLLIGSITERVLRNTDTPLLAVRH